MDEEFFDVVDEHDNVINTLSRSEVHRQKLRHRAVHVFLFRSDGKMLIHLRTADKTEFPSVWTSSASGHVSSGEDYASSAERELTEELGIVANIERTMKVDACPDTCFEFSELYVARSDDDVTPDPNEIADIRWLTLSEIDSELDKDAEAFSPAFRLLYSRYRKRRHIDDVSG